MFLNDGTGFAGENQGVTKFGRGRRIQAGKENDGDPLTVEFLSLREKRMKDIDRRTDRLQHGK